MTVIGEFEGRDVVAASMTITGTGDGLSKPLELDPILLHVGDTFSVVLECKVTELAHVAAGDGDGLVRKHKAKAARAAIVPSGGALHRDTTSLLNGLAERMAEAGISDGAIPGQQTITDAADDHVSPAQAGHLVDDPDNEPWESPDPDPAASDPVAG